MFVLLKIVFLPLKSFQTPPYELEFAFTLAFTHRTINTRFDTDLKNLKISQFSWKSCDEGLRKNSTERG
jgi:hypothetical protein